jgi:hypothetical protein
VQLQVFLAILMLKHKFKAKPVIDDGIKFASKKEHKRYIELKTLQKYGEVLFFLRQVPFHLPGNVKYVCDYLVFWTNNEVTIEDSKGMKTAMYILKKKQVETIYPIKIIEC